MGASLPDWTCCSACYTQEHILAKVKGKIRIPQVKLVIIYFFFLIKKKNNNKTEHFAKYTSFNVTLTEKSFSVTNEAKSHPRIAKRDSLRTFPWVVRNPVSSPCFCLPDTAKGRQLLAPLQPAGSQDVLPLPEPHVKHTSPLWYFHEKPSWLHRPSHRKL